MQDLISRQAAKLKVARVIWEDGDSCYDFHDKCVDCLDDVPSAQPEPKWIPVMERLPEIKQRVLITYNTEDGLKTDVTWYDKYGFMLSGDVTAWMPMVEPYRAERRTDD